MPQSSQPSEQAASPSPGRTPQQSPQRRLDWRRVVLWVICISVLLIGLGCGTYYLFFSGEEGATVAVTSEKDEEAAKPEAKVSADAKAPEEKPEDSVHEVAERIRKALEDAQEALARRTSELKMAKLVKQEAKKAADKSNNANDDLDAYVKAFNVADAAQAAQDAAQEKFFVALEEEHAFKRMQATPQSNFDEFDIVHARLDAMQEQLNETKVQLEVKADKTYVDDQLATLRAEIKEAFCKLQKISVAKKDADNFASRAEILQLRQALACNSKQDAALQKKSS